MANAGLLKPSATAKAIEAEIPYKFSVYSHFTRAWRKLGVRPPSNDSHPERTLPDYCIYDGAHRDYLYTQEFIAKIVQRARTKEGFLELTGIEPVEKGSA